MSSIVDFVKSLLPSFKKDQVLDSCKLTKQSLQEHTLPAYEAADTLFKGRAFASKELEAYSALYSKAVDNVKGTQLITDIKDKLINAVKLLDHVADTCAREFSTTEANLALTFKKATYLRTVQSAEFASTYARKFLNYVYILETKEADKHTTLESNAGMVKVEVKWIEDNFVNFCSSCSILGFATSKYDEYVKRIPEATISDLSESTLGATLPSSKSLDPFLMQGISVSRNPFYLIALVRAEYQAKAYNRAKEEVELLQLRKLNLEKLQAKEPDAKIQKQIEYMANRIDGLNYKIAELQKDYDV